MSKHYLGPITRSRSQVQRPRLENSMQNFEEAAFRAGERAFQQGAANILGINTPPNSGRTRERSRANTAKNLQSSGDGPIVTNFIWKPSRSSERDKMAKKMLDMSTASTVIETATAQIAGTVGRTVHTAFGSYLSRTEIQTVQSGTSNEQGCFIDKLKWEWMLVNSANIGVYVHAYYLTCAKASDADPLSFWASRVNDQAAQNDMELHYSAHPYDLPDFKEYWRIDRVDNMYIAPGKHWEGHLEYDCKFYASTADALSTSTVFMKGISKYVFLVSYGIPTSTVVTSTGVGTGEIYLGGAYHLNLIRSKKTKYTVFDLQTLPNYDVAGDLATTIANSGTTQHRVMLEDEDTAAVFDTAD